jgi:hypothetical protein
LEAYWKTIGRPERWGPTRPPLNGLITLQNMSTLNIYVISASGYSLVFMCFVIIIMTDINLLSFVFDISGKGSKKSYNLLCLKHEYCET